MSQWRTGGQLRLSFIKKEGIKAVFTKSKFKTFKNLKLITQAGAGMSDLANYLTEIKTLCHSRFYFSFPVMVQFCVSLIYLSS